MSIVPKSHNSTLVKDAMKLSYVKPINILPAKEQSVKSNSLTAKIAEERVLDKNAALTNGNNDSQVNII